MNICIITSWYPTDDCPYNGIFVQEQAFALSKDHKVILIAVNVDYSSKLSFFTKTIHKSNQRAFDEYYLTVNRSLPIFNQYNFLRTAYKSIKKILHTKNIEIIHSHVSYPSGILAYWLSKSLNIPYCITEHSSPFESLFRSIFHKSLVFKAMKKADSLITVSKSSEINISKYLRKEIAIVHNLLSDNKLRPIKKIASEIFHLGFLGGLNTDQKGLDILLKAININENKDFINLHIGGDGLLLESYKDMARQLNLEEMCHFYGSIKPDEVQSFMQKLDIFVLSSRHETFGIVAIEAMACGVPIVATNCGGPQEYVDAENGVLTENESIEGLSAGISKIINNYSIFDRKKIQSKVFEKFGTTAFLKNINLIYEQLK